MSAILLVVCVQSKALPKAGEIHGELHTDHHVSHHHGKPHKVVTKSYGKPVVKFAYEKSIPAVKNVQYTVPTYKTFSYNTPTVHKSFGTGIAPPVLRTFSMAKPPV